MYEQKETSTTARHASHYEFIQEITNILRCDSRRRKSKAAGTQSSSSSE